MIHSLYHSFKAYLSFSPESLGIKIPCTPSQPISIRGKIVLIIVVLYFRSITTKDESQSNKKVKKYYLNHKL